eukprot:Gregarina_sp_Poly_1__2574@NODE_169_length_12074_cov_67_888981_g150_i0_p1_GENE_NODE_169_length_12074_cov_67_888981_g150_i0NODE_169_length_12074_cov_67_888981_g150_i0_p1_ORF_typecomplete_len1694_score270_90_NODE_169_length_12074_cov_67_888981_g150_i039058986
MSHRRDTENDSPPFSASASNSVLELLAAAQVSLSQIQDTPSTEQPRQYKSQRDWWLQQVEDRTRDLFRHNQWHLSGAKSLAQGVAGYWKQRRWQEATWKAHTISAATRDFWKSQNSQIKWPPHVSGFSAHLPEFRPARVSVSAPTGDAPVSNKRLRSPPVEAASPAETQRRSKRRRRIPVDVQPPAELPASPSPAVMTTSPSVMMTQVDSQSLLFGKRMAQSFWPAARGGDGTLQVPSPALEDYAFRVLHAMSLAAAVSVNSELPVSETASAGPSTRPRRNWRPHRNGNPRCLREMIGSNNTRLQCRLQRPLGTWDTVYHSPVLKVREKSLFSLLKRLDTLFPIQPLPSREILRAAPSLADQVIFNPSNFEPIKLVDLYQLDAEDKRGTQSGIDPTPLSKPVQGFARIKQIANQGSRVEYRHCKGKGTSSLWISADEPLSEVKTLASLMCSGIWDVQMSLRSLSRLQKLLNISELHLSEATVEETARLASGRPSEAAETPLVEATINPSIHGFQEYAAHVLLKSTAASEWTRRFAAKIKCFMPVDGGVWRDEVSKEAVCGNDWVTSGQLDLPLESLLFLSRRHTRDKRKTSQPANRVATSLGPTESFKLEQALQEPATHPEDSAIKNAVFSKPSLLRRSANIVNRTPAWALALRLSAFAKLQEGLWEVVPNIVASCVVLGGPLFDPQGKTAPNAPVLRFKKEDSALSSLLTLLNRSIRIPDPIILYSRMVRQLPLSVSKTESDGLSAISNQFCLPTILSVKGPSRIVRRLEFSWNPAEEIVLWSAVMTQLRGFLKDNLWSKSGLLSVTGFLDCWRQMANHAAAKSALRLPATDVLSLVNWEWVAAEVNQILKPFDRSRSSVVCEAKFVSILAELALGVLNPLKEYSLLTSSPFKTEQGIPDWERYVLSQLQSPLGGEAPLQLSLREEHSFQGVAMEYALLTNETSEAQILTLHMISDLSESAPTSCVGSCSLDTVRERIGMQIHCTVAISVSGLKGVFNIIREAWCDSCLGHPPADLLQTVVVSPVLRETLAEFERVEKETCEDFGFLEQYMRTECSAAVSSIDYSTLCAQSPHETAELSKMRDALQRLGKSNNDRLLELPPFLDGNVLEHSVECLQAEVSFQKSVDYQAAGGLVSPLVLRLITEDKGDILTREISDWHNLCLHGDLRLTETPSPSANATTLLGELRARWQRLRSLTTWMTILTATDQLVRLASHLSLFHTNSAKRRRMLLSQEGQIENYYLDHHLRAHVHMSPACLSLLQCVRDVMTREGERGVDPASSTFREVTPASVFHHTCLHYNKSIFPCHASHDILKTESETRLTNLFQAVTNLVSPCVLLKNNELDVPAVNISLPPALNAIVTSIGVFCRTPRMVSGTFLSRVPSRELHPELLFNILFRDTSPETISRRSSLDFHKNPFPSLKLSLEDAQKASTQTQSQVNKKESKNRRPGSEAGDVKIMSRPEILRNRNAPAVQHYQQMHHYRPSSITRPQVVDFKHIPNMQSVPQTWINYDHGRSTHYAMVTQPDPWNSQVPQILSQPIQVPPEVPSQHVSPSVTQPMAQPIPQHVPLQQPYLPVYQQAEPWRRQPSMKPSYQGSNSSGGDCLGPQPWSYPGVSERYPAPAYFDFRPPAANQYSAGEYPGYYPPQSYGGSSYMYGMYPSSTAGDRGGRRQSQTLVHSETQSSFVQPHHAQSHRH